MRRSLDVLLIFSFSLLLAQVSSAEQQSDSSSVSAEVENASVELKQPLSRPSPVLPSDLQDPWHQRKGFYLSFEAAPTLRISPLQNILTHPALITLFGGGYYFPTDCLYPIPVCIDGMVYARIGGNLFDTSLYGLVGTGVEFFLGHQHRVALTSKVGIGYGYTQTDRMIGTGVIETTQVNAFLMSESIGVLGRITPKVSLYGDLTLVSPLTDFLSSRTDLMLIIGTQFRP